MDFIRGSEKIIQDYGYWPTFHDDAIIKIIIDQSSVDVYIRMEARPGDVDNYFVCLTFDDVNCFKLNNNNSPYPNIIFDLKFRSDEEITCDITSSGIHGQIKAKDVSVRKLFISINLGEIKSFEQLHIVLAEELDFPKMYGRNWDAFWDAITGLVPMPRSLTINGWSTFEKKFKRDAEILQSCLFRYRDTYDSKFKVFFHEL